MTRARMIQTLRGWRKDRSGATAVEFGLLGPVFIAMLCGVMFFGTYLYNSNRVDSALFDASREVMLINEPTLENVRAEVETRFTALNLDGTTTTVSIGERDDGGREAIIMAAYTMGNPTAFLNTEGFVHQVEYRVPLWQN